jgi:hypothetical protein
MASRARQRNRLQKAKIRRLWPYLAIGLPGGLRIHE